MKARIKHLNKQSNYKCIDSVTTKQIGKQINQAEMQNCKQNWQNQKLAPNDK